MGRASLGQRLVDHLFIVAPGSMDVGQYVAALGIDGDIHIGLGGTCRQPDQTEDESTHDGRLFVVAPKVGEMPRKTRGR
ncbi:hypothetical protein D3C84_1160910 [compost metagenome]